MSCLPWSKLRLCRQDVYKRQGKYYVTASRRYDGSSKLAEGHKWGGFFAGALAWRITEEEFMKDIDWLNNLKLRVSFGQSGNDLSLIHI